MVQDFDLLTLTIQRNISSFNPTTVQTCRNTVNNASITISTPDASDFVCAAKTLYLSRWEASYKERQGTDYWEEVITVVYNPDTWSREVLNAGLRELNSGAIVPIFVNGVATTVPIPLTAAGAAITSSTTPYHYLTFDVRTETDFSTLNLS